MRNSINIWVCLFVALMLLVVSFPAYGGDAARIGTAGGEQVRVPVGARTLAMQGANIAFTSGLEAMYWNPAGFSSMKNSAAGTFSTMSLFGDADIRLNYAAIGVKMQRFGTIGFSIKSFDFGDIPITTNQDMDGESGATFSPSFITLGLTYSRLLTDAIQVGVTAKLINEGITRASASAFAFDIGIQYHNLGGLNGISMGLAVKNIGTDIQYAGSGLLSPNTFRELPTMSHQLPATVELGVGYKRNLNESNTLLVNGNFENNNFGNDAYKLGAEYMYTDLVALRGGYNFLQETDTEEVLYRWTAGVGLHYMLSNTGLTFNYAYRDSQYFTGNSMFELIIGF
jgi:hypothetical protein